MHAKASAARDVDTSGKHGPGVTGQPEGGATRPLSKIFKMRQ